MRNVILIAAAVFELLLCIYCLASKSNRTWVGYICAAGAFLLFIGTLYLLLFPKHSIVDTTGKYQVATVPFTYVDNNRLESYTNDGENRILNVQFWYPNRSDKQEDQTFPLVIFSHGGFGIRSSNESLYHELASHGYVVASIDHTYQCLYTKSEGGKRVTISMEYMKEVSDENARANRDKSYNYYQKWMGIRMGDIDYVIDTIIANADEPADNNKVYSLVDTSKIGVMGHSMGGSAALGIGRSRNDVSAVIALESPFMYDIRGIENGEFVWEETPYPIPVLNIYSDSSWGHLEEWPQYAENARLLSDKQEHALNIYMKGGGHFSLTDLALTSPFLTRMFNGQKSTVEAKAYLKQINEVCLAFFDSYLKATHMK